MMAVRRSDRVADLIFRELSLIIRERSADPRLAEVTFTAAEMSDDLKSTRVYFSLLEDDEKRAAQVVRALKKAESFLKRELSARIELRFMPKLNFTFDPGPARGDRINRLLKKVGHEETQAFAAEEESKESDDGSTQ
jgi:ribosome-binding factor A